MLTFTLWMCRYKDALYLGTQAIASVYETAALCNGCEGCRHVLLKEYVTTVSDARGGDQAVGGLILPSASTHPVFWTGKSRYFLLLYGRSELYAR